MFICSKGMGDFSTGLGVLAGPDEMTRKVQNKLIQHFGVKALPKYGADGYYGTETKEWLQKYQSEKGIPSTGDIDEATLQKMGLAADIQLPDSGVLKANVKFYKSTPFIITMSILILGGTLFELKRRRII